MNKRINAGADIHAGDGGYEISTQEKYEAFVKVRNKSLAQARIRELWYQAVQPHTGDSWAEQTEFMERFAELIVRECALTLESITVFVSESYQDFDNGYNKALLTGSTVIKQHFGVEE